MKKRNIMIECKVSWKWKIIQVFRNAERTSVGEGTRERGKGWHIDEEKRMLSLILSPLSLQSLVNIQQVCNDHYKVQELL